MCGGKCFLFPRRYFNSFHGDIETSPPVLCPDMKSHNSMKSVTSYLYFAFEFAYFIKDLGPPVSVSLQSQMLSDTKYMITSMNWLHMFTSILLKMYNTTEIHTVKYEIAIYVIHSQVVSSFSASCLYKWYQRTSYM